MIEVQADAIPTLVRGKEPMAGMSKIYDPRSKIQIPRDG
jgi:hypothetical protein